MERGRCPGRNSPLLSTWQKEAVSGRDTGGSGGQVGPPMTRRSRRPSAPRGERGLLSTQPHPSLVSAPGEVKFLAPPSLHQFRRTAPALSRCLPSRPRPWPGRLGAAGPRGQTGDAYCGWGWTGSQLGAAISLCVFKPQPALSEPQPRLTPTGYTEGILKPRSESEKPGQWQEGFSSATGVPKALLGKGPGRSGQTTGEGCEETAR